MTPTLFRSLIFLYLLANNSVYAQLTCGDGSTNRSAEVSVLTVLGLLLQQDRERQQGLLANVRCGSGERERDVTEIRKSTWVGYAAE